MNSILMYKEQEMERILERMNEIAKRSLQFIGARLDGSFIPGHTSQALKANWEGHEEGIKLRDRLDQLGAEIASLKQKGN